MRFRILVSAAFFVFVALTLNSTLPGGHAQVLTAKGQGRAVPASAAEIPAGEVSAPGGVSRHAVGDFNADGKDELLLDLGAGGMWWWDRGSWNQISTSNMEGMVLAEYDGDAGDEVFVDRGASGLWVFNFLSLSQLTASLPETMAAGDVDGDGMDEALADLWSAGGASAPLGLWKYDSGAWDLLLNVNLD